MEFLFVPIAVVALVYAGHRLALHAESRGWIFYTIRPPRIRVLGFLEELVDPRVEYMVEEQSSSAIRADRPSSGDGIEGSDLQGPTPLK